MPHDVVGLGDLYSLELLEGGIQPRKRKRKRSKKRPSRERPRTEFECLCVELADDLQNIDPAEAAMWRFAGSIAFKDPAYTRVCLV